MPVKRDYTQNRPQYTRSLSLSQTIDTQIKDKTLTDAERLSSHSTLHKSRIKAIYKHCQISPNNVMIWNKEVSFLQASNTNQSKPFSTGPKLQHLIIHDFNQINIPNGGW